MEGIEAIKAVAKLGFDLGKGIEKSLADDKLTVSDAANFLPLIQSVGPALSHINSIGKEVKELDDAERAELKAFVKENFDLDDDKAEEATEAVLDLVIELSGSLAGVLAAINKIRGN